jgi:hypothetical protein
MALGAISGDTVRRTHWFKRPWFLASAIVLLVAVVVFATSDSVRSVVWFAVGMSLYGVTSAKQVDQATALLDDVTSAIIAIHHFPSNSASRPDRPPVFVNPGSRLILTLPVVVSVYEVTDKAEQDKVIAAVQALLPDHGLESFDLQFMDHENWIVHGNVGERGPELQLRRVRISQGRVQEEGGEKTITYLPKELQ